MKGYFLLLSDSPACHERDRFTGLVGFIGRENEGTVTVNMIGWHVWVAAFKTLNGITIVITSFKN